MHASQSVLVLPIQVDSATAHIDKLKSILEQASFEVLTLETLPASCRADPGRLVHSATRPLPSAIILFMDKRTLTVNASPGSLLGSFPAEVPIIAAAQDFDASQIQMVLELGAADFIIPPFTPEGVLPRIWRLARRNRLSSPPGGSVREKLGMRRLDLFGESPSFLEETRKLPLLARCDVTVMIRGETGTGKELIARALHYLSPRYDRPFVPIDCGAIPPELAESELFGHERGAFTGAVTRSPGLISTADQGTLFLDEVDGLGLSVQAKLLRFLQEMEYRPLGSNTIKRADVRVISATNGDLQKRVRNGEFREDLYYRLNVVQLRLPALRHRLEDVVLLARHFLAKYSARFNRTARDFSPDALQKLLMHEWPGNIRELENVVEAAVALCDAPLIRAGDLLFGAQESHRPLSFREAKAHAISEFERDYIVRLLYACGGNISEAARAAGKNRRAFWELIRKHRVDVREFRGSAEETEGPRPSARAMRAGARNSFQG